MTTYEYKPEPGVKYSRILGLVDDLCLALKAEAIRIDRISGRSTVGVEVPNSRRRLVRSQREARSRASGGIAPGSGHDDQIGNGLGATDLAGGLRRPKPPPTPRNRAGLPQSLNALTSWGAAWIVLGVSRLHYTLATAKICSKEAAGLYAREAFSERWHRVVDESLRIRRADRARPDAASACSELAADLRIRPAGDLSLYRTPLDRRRDAIAFGEMVITDAHERFDHLHPP